jgi:uncharacterized protein (UPF0332 family)
VDQAVIRGRDFLRVAKKLSGDEAHYRTAIGRAYYAAFNEVSAYVTRRGYTPSGGDSHDRIWNHLKNHVPDTDPDRAAPRRAVADLGFQLKDRRQKADYRLQQTVSDRERRVGIDEAQRIIDTLDDLTAGK